MSRVAGHFWIDETCIGCGACEHACPGKVDAIFKIPDDFCGRFAIAAIDCIDCGLCIPTCPVDCIHDGRATEPNEPNGLVSRAETSGAGGYREIRDLHAWAAARPTDRVADNKGKQ